MECQHGAGAGHAGGNGATRARFTLIDPAGKPQPLSVDALGGDRYGITLADLTERGIYRVRAERGDSTAASKADPNSKPAGPDSAALLWEIPLAVNGPAEESELQPSKDQAGVSRFIDVSAQVYTESPLEFQGIDIWKWLIGLVLALLLAEFLLAARTTPRPEVAS